MLNIVIAEHMKNHKYFKRVKNTVYNYSFYFSTKKSENVRVEAMIGLSTDGKDMMWRFSIFENGLVSESYNSINDGIENVDTWFKNLIIEVFKLSKKENNLS